MNEAVKALDVRQIALVSYLLLLQVLICLVALLLKGAGYSGIIVVLTLSIQLAYHSEHLYRTKSH
jgi:hypothetical protein